MIDVKNAKDKLSNREKKFIALLEENGYSGRIIRKYANITKFKLSKDNMITEYNFSHISRTHLKKDLSRLEFIFNLMKECREKEKEYENLLMSIKNKS